MNSKKDRDMPKLIRPTYPPQFTITFLTLIFIIASLLSFLIFDVPFNELDQNKNVYFGMILVGIAVIVMVLIIWEEFLFPIKVKEVQGGVLFRNHSTKLRTQALIYCIIPAIFCFIYLEYEVSLIRFLISAGICVICPVLEKLASGITNYNDFLKLTNDKIEYKDNEKEGSFEIKDIQKIVIIKDDSGIIKNIQISLRNNMNVIIDLHNMELDAFYDSIYEFITINYINLFEEKNSAQ